MVKKSRELNQTAQRSSCYSDRDWKSAKSSVATKANTATRTTENKIESMGMIISSSDVFLSLIKAQPHLMTHEQLGCTAGLGIL